MYHNNTTNNIVRNTTNNTVSNVTNNIVSSEANIPEGQHRMPDGSIMNDSDMLGITAAPPAITAVEKPSPPPTIPTISNISPFGFYANAIETYPNDIIRLDIYNGANQYIETNYRVGNYIKEDYKVSLNPEQNLKDLGYISGRYKITYNFHRNLLGSGDGHKLEIQEISSDGLEIRVLPVNSATLKNSSYRDYFSSNFFKLTKAQTLVNLFLFKDANNSIQVFDYVQDKQTVVSSPYSIVFKLNSPVPASFIIGTELWLAQQVSDPVTDSITIVPPKLKTNK